MVLANCPADSKLSRTIEIIDARLIDAFEKVLAKTVNFAEGCPTRLGDAIRYSLLSRGKRLRPILLFNAAAACGSEPEPAMPAACAVEMIHAYSLIHDDLPAMDDDDMRRGQPSCHIAFDEATAILAGDALQARAFEVLATQIQPAEKAARCCAELAHAAGPNQLVGGQADDLDGWDEQNTSESQQEWLQSVNQRKTSALFVTSLRLGGIVAGASPCQLGPLTEYGKNLGLAFQIVDDLLDLHGNEQRIGKRVGQDARQGMRTFPAILGAEQCVRLRDELIAAAIGCLGEMGPDAAPLIALAHYIGQRDH